MSEDLENFTVRPAGPDDLDSLQLLYRHLIPDDRAPEEQARRETYERMLSQPGLTILLGCRGETAVSTCTLVIVPNLTRGCRPYALIENVVTLTDHRGAGHGEAVMSAAIRKAWDAGCFKIMLLSGSTNTKAHRFYDRLGFSRSKTGFELRAKNVPTRAPDENSSFLTEGS